MKYDIVGVTWEDIVTHNLPTGTPEELGCYTVYTAGIYYKKTDKFLYIAQSYCNDNNEFDVITVIPNGCLVKIEKIGEFGDINIEEELLHGRA